MYRRVNAAYSLLPSSESTDHATYNIVMEKVGNRFVPRRDNNYARMQSHRAIHRDLWLGNGFWQCREASGALQLPVANLFEGQDNAMIGSIVEEVIPVDQQRFHQYLSNIQLGFGLVTAGPGTGKTTVIAAVTIAMRFRFGPVACTAPNNVTVDNFAQRIDTRAQVIIKRINEKRFKGKPPTLPNNRMYCPLVIRGYSAVEELAAFRRLLGATESRVGPNDKWKLPLSVAFWGMVVLESENVRGLHGDTPRHIVDLREQMKAGKRSEWMVFRHVATGRKSYAQASEEMDSNLILSFFTAIVDGADVLCTTPAGFKKPATYDNWRRQRARAVTVDEAGAMHRSDLVSVWGNSLLPCVLSGDVKQLPPAVMTTSETWPDGRNVINRFAKLGSISPLCHFMAMGFPVYRLSEQFRMGNGLFDWVSEIVYPEVQMRYAAKCSVSLPAFGIGRDLEAFLKKKFPQLRSPPQGKLLPAFISCRGSKCETSATGSLRNQAQVKVTLDLIAEFVHEKKVDASRITVIAPYAANVECIKTLVRSESSYAGLARMPPPATVDSFQGQENDIVFVVMGTIGPKPGPGFTSNEQRLNVLLTRQRCGLVVVGDINVTGDLTRGNKPGELPQNADYRVVAEDGKASWKKPGALKAFHWKAFESGRVAKVDV